MEKFEEETQKAKKLIRIADHMLTQTYPLLKDPKLLLAVIDNIYGAVQSSIAAMLHYDRHYKRVPPFTENFEAMFSLFRDKYKTRFNFTQEYYTVIERLRDIVVQHKKSPIEFARKDKFVICSDNYRLRTLSFDEIKRYLEQMKDFVNKINVVVQNNEGISNRSK